MDCLFCKIIKKEISSQVIYENDKTLAFLDISPVNPGHTLVIPKEHFENLEAVPEEILCEVVKAVKIVGKAIKESISPIGYNIGVNNGASAGQIIPHLHFHVMPRLEGDGHHLWKQGEYAEGEAEAVLNKIKEKI